MLPALIQQILQFFTQTAENSAGVNKYGRFAQAKLPSDFGGGSLLDHTLPAGLPSVWLELVPHHFQGASHQVLTIFVLPKSTSLVSIDDLLPALIVLTQTLPRLTAAKPLATFVRHHNLEPATKRPNATMLKRRQLVQQQYQHVLNEVVRLGRLKSESLGPSKQQWRV